MWKPDYSNGCGYLTTMVVYTPTIRVTPYDIHRKTHNASNSQIHLKNLYMQTIEYFNLKFSLNVDTTYI